MAILGATKPSLLKGRNQRFWESLFPNALTAGAGDYILDLLNNGSTDRFCLGVNFCLSNAFLSEYPGLSNPSPTEIDKAIDDAITVLLANRLIETWEDDDDSVITTYYNLPEDDDPSLDAASRILDLIDACGSQEIEQLRKEVHVQTVGVNTSNVVEVTNQAIAFLLDNHLIEKTDDVDINNKPWTYYDLPEDDDDDDEI